MGEAAFTAKEFRSALSQFATGVTIVTSVDGSGSPVGMTASSFNSVSMDPPLILWSVSKDALSGDAFRTAPAFSVHVLSSGQAALSNHFAQRGIDKFKDVPHEIGPGGVPILRDAACRFDCERWAVYEGGDHWIIVGEVKGIHQAPREGLVFSGGSYATATPLRIPEPGEESTGTGQSPIDGLLVYNLSRAYHQMTRQFHKTITRSGMTVSQWRVLASLHGRETREFTDLVARTFVEPDVLPDLLEGLEEKGLCQVSSSGGGTLVTGTQSGHETVERFFELGRSLERAATSDDPGKLRELLDLLRVVISNTPGADSE